MALCIRSLTFSFLALLAGGFATADETDHETPPWPASVSKLESRIAEYRSAEYVARITKVHVAGDSVRVVGALPSGSGSFELVEGSIADGVPPWTGAIRRHKLATPGQFDVMLPRQVMVEGRTHDRLLSQWAIVQSDSDGERLVSPAHLADEIDATNDLPILKPHSQKGLGGFSAFREPVSDLDELGISLVTVNVTLGFLHTKSGAGRERFEYLGRDYYVDQRAIERYDRTFLEAAKRDIVTLAIVLVPPPHHFADKEVGRLMCHAGYDKAGIFAMPNVATRDGYEVYCAALDFLARRYSRPDGKFGRIHHWIAHNECDAGWEWTNAGRMPMSVYLDLYYRSMRTLHNIARQYDAHSEVMISLTHRWTWAEDEKYYAPRDMLAELCRVSKQEGDFRWGVAYHPYPQSLFEPTTWNDQQAEPTATTPKITMRNIEVLVDWTKSAEARYRGEQVRTIHLSEQGFNSSDYRPETLRVQAAAMAYAWQKLKQHPEIVGFEYHNWVDNRHEGGLRIGLRKFPDDANDPLGAKPIWNVYRDIGTEREPAACEFALPIIGMKSWDELASE